MLKHYASSPALLIGVVALVFLYLVFPLVVVVPISFSAGEGLAFPPPSYSLRWYEHYVTDRAWMDATVTSLKVAALTMVMATTAGTLAAIGLSRLDRGRGLMTGFFLSPLVVPVVVLAIAVYRFFGLLGLNGSALGLAIAHTIIATPFVVLTVSAGLARFDTQVLLASASLGARPTRTFFKVMLPLIRPSVLTGALFAFMTSFDEVVIALFVGSGPVSTLPRVMWASMRSGIDPTIAAVSTLLIVLSLLVLAGSEVLRRRTERALGG
ncbi:ABC transporter permease [Labrys wisconsinensis]|uniref:Spermidine/putrescine transport system permease protein n=1 Tax=Labrys wisconsinensis TaxID=425677 RepID=A0ABU0JC13_9HYPH|nr:ABC transporter permease [Labrys wisconsinensis]MDQ0471818.1 putative spermidine/putrescine transport system permease protein [Labrys wisconsinensis]